MSSRMFCMTIIIFLNSKCENLICVYKSAVIRGNMLGDPFPFLCSPPSNYFCLIQMLSHRCYLGANVWVNVFTFYYIGMMISISVLSFYSDGYYFSFHVVDIFQSFGLAIVTVVVPLFSHFGYLVVNFLSHVNFIFLLFQLHLHTLKYPKQQKNKKYLR